MSGPLDRLERALEGLVEGTAERWFPSGVHPVQLAHGLEALMQERAIDGARERLAPNRFVVRLDARTADRLEPVREAIERDLEEYLEDAAATRRLALHPPVRVWLEPDAALPGGRVSLDATFEEEPRGHGPLTEPTVGMPELAGTSGDVLAVLEVVEDGATPRRIAIGAEDTSIGRAEENDVTLADRAVSRRHATVQLEDGQFVVVDLDSANGTQLNGRLVRRAALDDGDRLHFGTTEVIFRQLHA
ncbi:MAG: DUF2662 domain-containing protein [Dehalococcoidia bacterium]|nr:DUF2662 domain-containing protein [Dehalococcoidia bacterium]